MRTEDTIFKLLKFKSVDKYEAFHEILPSVRYSSQKEKDVVSDILDECCADLLRLLRGEKRPTKPVLKKVLVTCMDQISIAPVDGEHKEFGYQLGWYLAEKVAVNLRKGTEKKVWGYWQIEADEVKAPIRPRVSGKSKRKAPTKEAACESSISIV